MLMGDFNLVVNKEQGSEQLKGLLQGILTTENMRIKLEL